MKSMKLASGFAISALALAIAGTATAQTTTEVDFTGSVKVNTVLDFDAEDGDPERANGIPGFVEVDDDWFNLEATWTVTNGPFSGDLIVGVEEHAGGVGVVEVDNLIVAEGPISFGQVGSVVNTAGLIEGMTDYRIFEALGSDELDLSYDVEAGFRYSLDDFGLQVQGEGATPDDWGFAAAVTQDLDVATVWADFQYREEVGGVEDGETFFGVAAQVTPVDMVTLTAALNNQSASERTAFGVTLDVAATDTVSLAFGYVDVDLGDEVADESDFVTFGMTAGFAPITLELGYQAWVEEVGEGILESKVSYAAAPFGTFAEFNLGLGGAENVVSDYFEVVLGVDYTTDSGIVYGAEYSMTDVSESSPILDESDSNQVELFAQYSF